MHYSNDLIEADPLAWEDSMFDEAESMYEKIDEMQFSDDESTDDNEAHDEQIESWKNTSYMSLDEYYDAYYANFDEKEFTEESFNQMYDSPCSFEDWKQMRLWQKNNPIECKEWILFSRMHCFYIKNPDWGLDEDEWNLNLLHSYWLKWVGKSDEEREQLLAEDAEVFERNYGIKYSDHRAYSKWCKNNHVLHSLFLYDFFDWWLDPTDEIDEVEELQDRINYWKEWTLNLEQYDTWKKTANIQELQKLEKSILNDFELRGDGDYLIATLKDMGKDKEEIQKIITSADYDTWKDNVLYYLMAQEYEFWR